MIVPMRNTTNLKKAREQYKFSDRIKLVSLPVIEVSHIPFLRRFAFQCSVISFSFRIAQYLRHSSASWVMTTDHLPALIASFCGKKVLIEVHDFPKTWNPIWRLLLSRADIVMSTNTWKAAELNRRFRVDNKHIFVERNGIDLDHFGGDDKVVARGKLNLPVDARIILYTGNLYSWKGVDTLIAAAQYLPGVLTYIVGGTPEDQQRMRAFAGSTVHFIPRTSHNMMPIWQSAADLLILPNTAREQISVRYTSPMKLFEYMASRRPIVASDLPSIREILPDKAGFFFRPDDPKSLAGTILGILENPLDASLRAEQAYSVVEHYTWSVRAVRLLGRMNIL